MAQFPKFLFPPTPGGIMPSPLQVKPLNLGPLIAALEKSGTRAAAQAKAAKKESDDDLKIEGLIGAIQQSKDQYYQAEQTQRNLANAYGLDVAMLMPSYQQAQALREDITSQPTNELRLRAKKQKDDWYKDVQSAKATSLYDPQLFLDTEGEKTMTYGDIGLVQEHGKFRQIGGFDNGGNYLSGEESDGHSYMDDYSYNTNFLTEKDAVEQVNRLFDSAQEGQLTSSANANVFATEIGNAVKGIMTTKSDYSDNFKNMDLALQEALKEVGISEKGMDLSNPILGGYFQGFLQKSNGGLEWGGKKLRNEDGKINDEFYKGFSAYVSGQLELAAEKRKEKQYDVSKSFQEQSEFAYNAQGALDRQAEMFAAQTSAETITATDVMAGQDVARVLGMAATGNTAISELSSQDMLELAQGLGIDISAYEASFGGGADIMAMTMGKKQVDEMRGKLASHIEQNIGNALASQGILQATEVLDGNGGKKTAYKLADDAGEQIKKLKLKLGGSEADQKLVKALDNLYATQLATQGQKQIEALAGVRSEVRIINFQPEHQKSLETALKGREAGANLVAVPISVDGGKTFLDGSSLKGLMVEDVEVQGFLMPGAGAANWNPEKQAFTDSNGNPTVPSFQGASERGYVLPILDQKQAAGRLQMVEGNRDNQEAIYAAPNQLMTLTTMKGDEKAFKEFAKNTKSYVQVAYNKYKDSDLDKYKGRATYLNAHFAPVEQTGYKTIVKPRPEVLKKEGFNEQQISTILALNEAGKNDEARQAVASFLFENEHGAKAANFGRRKIQELVPVSNWDDANDKPAEHFAKSADVREVVDEKGGKSYRFKAAVTATGVVANDAAANAAYRKQFRSYIFDTNLDMERLNAKHRTTKGATPEAFSESAKAKQNALQQSMNRTQTPTLQNAMGQQVSNNNIVPQQNSR
jgi:hypothetical protein